MNIRDEILGIAQEAAEWRRALHRHPQTSYEERFASDFVAQKLAEWNIPHERGWAKTGIVATIAGSKTGSGKAIGLRADMDALNIKEQANKPWVSEIDGKMHGCGHDGHTAMLLAAARYLSENRDFNGTVYLIFQPAEESGNGALRVIEEGLFEKYPMDFIYGLHNWPGLPKGQMAVCPGPIMGASDYFAAEIRGVGGHAAMPHNTKDPVIAAAGMITAIQNFISREVDPLDSAVISVTNVAAGTGSLNVIPDQAVIKGAVRTLYPAVRDRLEKRLGEILQGTAQASGVTVSYTYTRDTEATINDAEQAAFCAGVAAEIVGTGNIDANVKPSMAAEDFGAFLSKIPGCYIWLGQNSGEDGTPCSHSLHTPHYDFNDDVIATGAEYWVRLVEMKLGS
ncbi:MAG: amidohydrolase [Rhodospirillales bacterium]|nr:amidohydrolase [Rhodospirillales bacterium]